MSEQRKTVIIGGVAGGASCAARLRRLDADREIVILERGAYISYANCGLPYHVGDVVRSVPHVRADPCAVCGEASGNQSRQGGRG